MMNPAEFANIARGEEQFWWFRGMREMLHGMLEPHLSGRRLRRALEAGCGIGYFARTFQQRYPAPIFPLDLSPEGLRYARELGMTRLAQADIAALPFDSGAFDLVLSLDVIVHFPRGQEQRAMKELARVLSPGGLLVIRASALDILRSRHSEFACERQRFTRRRLVHVAGRAGIRVLRCTYANTLLLPVALFKFRVWEPLLRQAPSSGTGPVPGWLNRLLYSALRLESRWLNAGHDFPLGQSLILIGEKVA